MRRFRLRGRVPGCLIILVAMFLCSGITTFAVDRLCYVNLTERLPMYPNATVKTRVHNLFSELGMGNTAVIMTTPDDPDTVRAWYAEETAPYLRLDARNNMPFSHVAHGQVDITHNPDGEGSQIILFGTCVN